MRSRTVLATSGIAPRYVSIGATSRIIQIHRTKLDFRKAVPCPTASSSPRADTEVAAKHELVPHGVELGIGGGRAFHLVLLVQIVRDGCEQIELEDEIAETVE